MHGSSELSELVRGEHGSGFRRPSTGMWHPVRCNKSLGRESVIDSVYLPERFWDYIDPFADVEILVVDLLVGKVERLRSFAVGGMQGGQVCDGVWRTGGIGIRCVGVFSGSSR